MFPANVDMVIAITQVKGYEPIPFGSNLGHNQQVPIFEFPNKQMLVQISQVKYQAKLSILFWNNPKGATNDYILLLDIVICSHTDPAFNKSVMAVSTKT